MEGCTNLMLTQIYEIEGLLHVMHRRSDDVPQHVLDSLKAKVDALRHEITEIENERDKKQECSLETEKEITITPVHNEAVAPEPPVEPQAEEVSESNVETTSTTATPITPQSTPIQPERNILSAFSINDRFYIQRELFDGNNNLFNDAIARMQSLSDMEQVTQFLTQELKFDIDSDEVKEFIRLIGLSFN